MIQLHLEKCIHFLPVYIYIMYFLNLVRHRCIKHVILLCKYVHKIAKVDRYSIKRALNSWLRAIVYSCVAIFHLILSIKLLRMQ